jgi:hypothetical protein
MSGGGNLDQHVEIDDVLDNLLPWENAQYVEIEDVLDNFPWENQTVENENSENSYERGLLQRSNLKILQVGRANHAGLLKLFISRSQCLKEDGIHEGNESKINAYIGLELAMSLLQFNNLDEYIEG